MLAAQLHSFDPTDLRVDEIPEREPGVGEILLEMLAAPVNPADLNTLEGKYGELPVLPAIPGSEGVGRILKLGPGVTNFAPGDWALPMSRGTWAGHMLVRHDEAVHIPATLDRFQAAMLTVNPLSAWAMLKTMVSLEPGEWIVQNASNSAVGRCVIQLAKAWGLRSLNVVRRTELVPELLAIGADAVVTEDCDLRENTREICGAQLPRLALNSVGGASALNLANALADSGTLVTYGAMGRQPLKIPNGLLIFRGLRFDGFWLTRWRRTISHEELRSIVAELASLSEYGHLQMPVHKAFPLSQIHEALVEAAQPARPGKILLDLSR